MFLYFSIYLFILISFLHSTHQSAAVPWYLCSPELLLVQFLLFSLYCLSFPSFNLPSCFFHIFSPPAAKVVFFCVWFAFYFCLFLSVISPFLLILFFPFFPFTSPSLHCLLPLVNGQSLSFPTVHYFWLPGRQTGSAIGVSSAYNYLPREENCAVNRDSCLQKT